MNYLFVCSGNAVRSPFAEEWFSSFCDKYGLSHQVDSAAAYCPERDEEWFNRINLSWMFWADRVVVMEQKMQDDISSWWPQYAQKLVCINVPDIFAEQDEWAHFELLDPGPDAALEWYNEHGYRHHFGPRSFGKILWANLDKILG